MEMINRSLRLERGSSLRLGRSNSLVLVSELVSSEIARITSYERLSKSMRVTAGERGGFHRRRKSSAWAFLSKVFSFRKTNDEIGQHAAENTPKPPKLTAGEQKRRRSSWLPNPHRRWPENLGVEIVGNQGGSERERSEGRPAGGPPGRPVFSFVQKPVDSM